MFALSKQIYALQTRFPYASYEHIQLEKAFDMVSHGNYGYALQILQEYTFKSYENEKQDICTQLNEYLNK